ncbi:MAG: DUF1684 domain-containing protein [Chloroflexi bacterium]|nr:DUF1684 domain-containing protein [Chloroflexota bacterium]
MSELTQFRESKDRYFKFDHHSPLLPEQQKRFGGLNYFDANPDLHFVLSIETYDDHQIVVMATSTGGAAEFLRYGKITFEVEAETASLTVYVSQNGGGFFLPFTDATTGDETYESGRYLEIDPQADGTYIVDFNMAYNPYCAYNDHWTCPIPPDENRLSVPIRAGEKVYPDAVHSHGH